MNHMIVMELGDMGLDHYIKVVVSKQVGQRLTKSKCISSLRVVVSKQSRTRDKG